jgi:hypothetical protein
MISIAFVIIVFAFGIIIGAALQSDSKRMLNKAFCSGHAEGLADSQALVEILGEVAHRAINDRHAAMLKLELAEGRFADAKTPEREEP